MKYQTENEIVELVRVFEAATISRADWRHAEHLTVALVYLSQNDFETAHRKMRDGIFNLLRAFDVDFSKEMPYHETLTVFWLKTVADYAKSREKDSLLEVCNDLVEKFDRDYPLKFYSREVLFSDAARANFVEGDIAGTPASCRH